MKNNKLKICIVFILSLLIVGGVMAKDSNTSSIQSLAKVNLNNTQQTMLNINNWGYWMYSSGKSGFSPITGGSGGFYPRGTSTVIYRDGLMWGGFLDGDKTKLRVGGNAYSVGTQRGWITSSGTAAPLDDPKNKIWRIRSDYKTLTNDMVRQEALEIFGVSSLSSVTDEQCQSIIAQYKEDWENWPGELGAPYYDNNNNGQWDPGVDTPGIADADQVVWFVANDLTEEGVHAISGNVPIGLEVQCTAWGYNQPDARLGQIIFKKYIMINKSGSDYTDFYVGQWCDPDVGNSGDDLLGCDTVLSMGFCYNGKEEDSYYKKFDLAPAAIGYDFFQGPIVPSDDPNAEAIWNFGKRKGYVNLPMTSFGWFASGSAIGDPEQSDIRATAQWYNLMRGYKPFDDINDPEPWLLGNMPGNPPTKFPMAGDPVANTGYLDNKDKYFEPGDRRMCLSTGPFNFAAGDTQEVVIGIIGGLSDSRLNSVKYMKNTDAIAQDIYDNAFKGIPKAPTQPKVTVSAFETSIVLEWGSDKEKVKDIENRVIAGYKFEGYNVYQLPSPSASLEEGVKLVTYDVINDVEIIEGKKFLPAFGQNVIVPVQQGTNSGIKRYFQVDKDYLTGNPLYEGKEYYFVVTAYNYNAKPELIESKTLESAKNVLPVVVQEAKPNTQYTVTSSELLNVAHSSGSSDGMVEVKVIDPAAVSGHQYEIFFTVDEDTSSATYGKTLWNVKDLNVGSVVIANQILAMTLNESDDQPIFDGLQVKVSGPPIGINPLRYGEAYGKDSPSSKTYLKGWDFTGTRWIGGRKKGWIGLFGGLGNGADYLGTSLKNGTDYMDVEIRFAGLKASPGAADTTVADLMALSKAENPDRWSKAVALSGWDNWGTYLADAPFAAYDVESSPERRLKIAIIEEGGSVSQNNIWDMGWNISEHKFRDGGGYEYFFILDDDYDETYTDYLSGGSLVDKSDGGWPVLYSISPKARGTHPYLEAEFNLQIFASNVIVAGSDKYTFTAPEVKVSKDIAKANVKNINVFPNPYYANNRLGVNRFDNYITFTHLPEKVKIRIFTINGIQVKTLDKNSSGQFLKWDLKNESGLPVASGMYVAHVDCPDLGKEKILKVMIIQKEQVLEFY